MREYLEVSVRLGGRINTKAMAAAVTCSMFDGGESAKMTSIKPRLGTGLADGWNGLAGQIAPQPTLADGARLDDRVGYKFAALLRPDFAASLPAKTRDQLTQRDVVVVADDAPEQQAWLEATGAPAVLVRPDRYVLGVAHSMQEMTSLIATI